LKAVEACPLLARQIQSIEFTLTRIFVKVFRAGSSSTVNECQVYFGFLPAKSRIRCSRMIRAGNYKTFLIKVELILKLHVNCVMLFIIFLW